MTRKYQELSAGYLQYRREKLLPNLHRQIKRRINQCEERCRFYADRTDRKREKTLWRNRLAWAKKQKKEIEDELAGVLVPVTISGLYVVLVESKELIEIREGSEKKDIKTCDFD